MSGVRRPRHDDGKLTVLTGAAARGEQGASAGKKQGAPPGSDGGGDGKLTEVTEMVDCYNVASFDGKYL